MEQQPHHRRGLLSRIKEKVFILEVPSYGNRIYFSLGFLALTALAILLASGIVLVFFGSAWWLTSPWGIFLRSVHLWAAQAMIAIVFLHLFVVFSTSAFRTPRRLTWIAGGLLFLFVLVEAEFGYDLRGDFSAQYRALQGADFWNGAFLGRWINTLNFAQVYGIHVIDIPIIILTLASFHYLLVKIRGLAKPYRDEGAYPMVPADHRKLFLRGGILAAAIILFASAFPSPFVAPATISSIANDDPNLAAQTLIAEFTRTSGTATYLDSINPYAFDTRAVYVTAPYAYHQPTSGASDALAALAAQSPSRQAQTVAAAESYFQNGGTVTATGADNPLVRAVSSLVTMAQSGLYQDILNGESPATNPTYALRFIADTGVLDDEAASLDMTTEQWGMMREERGKIPPGAWWLAPIGFLNHTILADDANGDRDGAEILGALVLLLIVFPFIPFVNRLPEKLPFGKWMWHTDKK